MRYIFRLLGEYMVGIYKVMVWILNVSYFFFNYIVFIDLKLNEKLKMSL